MALPFIPENITVHLGRPDENAPNVTLPFLDYIANVASSEIYPTWPENAIRANIYAQTSFALNRIYTEFYRARGYDFDITNSTAFDQSFVNGRDIFQNVRAIASELFDHYIQRQGQVEPLFAVYCDGVRVNCNGLSQWGTVDLAEQGYTPYEILTYYYGNDINLVTDTPIAGNQPSYPGIPLRIGSTGDDVRQIQIRLNRIGANYPALPKIVRSDGIFASDTENAVRDFQRIFGLTEDGIVGKATWYAILRIYNAVKRLNELDSEGITLDEVSKQYPENLAPGSAGLGVQNLQFFIDYISAYYDTVPSVTIDGIYGAGTEEAVRDVQRTFGLPVTGISDRPTWEALYRAYLGIVSKIPLKYTEGLVVPFPGRILRIGSDGEDVRLLQEYLNYIAEYFPEIPTVDPTGYFGERTEEAVLAFQNRFGLTPNGIVGALVWSEITSLYQDLARGNETQEGQFPGETIGGTT
ncbi:MAG: peptidoglycan-binding protein [Clostridia bacterium]|nr:peptidoglycan-binding protein [Clostridia bacterium]